MSYNLFGDVRGVHVRKAKSKCEDDMQSAAQTRGMNAEPAWAGRLFDLFKDRFEDGTWKPDPNRNPCVEPAWVGRILEIAEQAKKEAASAKPQDAGALSRRE
jgi:hypothetical protein